MIRFKLKFPVEDMYMIKHSQAHTRARASFSVWLYRRSTSDRCRDAYPITHHSHHVAGLKPAPSPTRDMSATILLLLFTLKKAKASTSVISSFNFLNATCCSLPNLNSPFLWVNLAGKVLQWMTDLEKTYTQTGQD